MAEQFTIVDDWAKLKHVRSKHEFMPSKLQDFLTSATFLESALSEKVEPVTEPSEISRFLKAHKSNNRMLFCVLTKKQIRNNWQDANLHVEGALFKHKFYEHLRARFQKSKRKLESELKITRKQIELGQMKRMRRGSNDQRNLLHKGFLKQRKL